MTYWTSGDSLWTDVCLTANDDVGGVGDIACGCCKSQQPSASVWRTLRVFIAGFQCDANVLIVCVAVQG